MAILIDQNMKVLVQGITGRTGSFACRYMLQYGTKIVAGVTPGRKGEEVWGVPVYNSVEEAKKEHGDFDASVLLIPAPKAKNAVLEALSAGIRLLVLPIERVPLHDTLEFIAHAKRRNATIIGPGTLGVISPGKAVLGWIGGVKKVADVAFEPGRIGVISRSGGYTTTTSWIICRHGLGISTAVHLGTEIVLGMSAADALTLFEKDDETDLVAYFGEIGGIMEEEMAEAIEQGEYTKQLVAYIAGRSLPSGIRFSHAGAMVKGGRGTVESKINALTRAGVHVANSISDIGPTVTKILRC